MKKNVLMNSLIAAMAMASAWPVSAAEYGPLELWRSYSGVTWTGEPFSASVNAPIAGVHMDRHGRTLVSVPRLITKDTPATLNIVDTSRQNGPAHLSAFPSVQENQVGEKNDQHLRSVLGFYVDNTNDWVWALDMGYVAGESEAPPGAQKVVVYELKTGRRVKTIALDSVADRKTSFLNDIVVDEHRKIAYISDSGLRGNAGGLIVVAFNGGKARRLLDRAASVQPETGVDTTAHGMPVLPGSPLRVGINGIALSPDASMLYWTVTTGLHAHGVPTAVLNNMQATDDVIAAQVRDLGSVGGNTDGIVTTPNGDLYMTDVTRNGIVRYDVKTRQMTLLAADERIHWPDTITVSNDGDLMFTSSALNEHFMGAIKQGEERYDFWRLPLVKK